MHVVKSIYLGIMCLYGRSQEVYFSGIMCFIGKLENAQAEAKFGEGTELAEGDHALQDKALHSYAYMKVHALMA